MLQRLQVVRWHILKYSHDPNIKNLYHYRLNRDKAGHYGRGRKTSPSLQLEALESEAKFQQMLGHSQHGTSGLGYRKQFRPLTDSDKERRRQLGIIMRKDAEQKRLVILQNYESQNSWLSWGLSDW